MTDRELLELAAKASGYETIQFSDYSGFQILEDGDSRWWNPIDKDGDALRLAVKLNLALVFHPVLNQALVRPYHTREMEHECREDGEKHSDPYAATRRAIVRAAAEIGKAMP